MLRVFSFCFIASQTRFVLTGQAYDFIDFQILLSLQQGCAAHVRFEMVLGELGQRITASFRRLNQAPIIVPCQCTGQVEYHAVIICIPVYILLQCLDQTSCMSNDLTGGA